MTACFVDQQATCKPTNPRSAETSYILFTPSLPADRSMLVPSGIRCDPAWTNTQMQTCTHTHTRMHIHKPTRIGNSKTRGRVMDKGQINDRGWVKERDTYDMCCSVLKCVEVRGSLWHCAVLCCSVMQCGADSMNDLSFRNILHPSATLEYRTSCNTLQHTTTHCTILQNLQHNCNTL